ncbi:MAG: dihydroneopterin triphosphate diphosphatase [Rhodocyclaceae bacterium]|nr:dihydroneopterin triphosphate diphosphatase [Rhodocyclaceae bacterium]
MSKRPESVLVVIHVAGRHFLMMKRAGVGGFWQSVTGSLEPDETPLAAAIREVGEETGLEIPDGRLLDHRLCNRFEIPLRWRERYPPGTTHNVEHVFSLAIEDCAAVRRQPEEHVDARWVDTAQALAMAWSWTNRDGIRLVAVGSGAASAPAG